MKRKAIAILLHPFKNRLVPGKILKESLGRFFETIFDLLQRFPQLRFNLVVAGYQLECVDPILIARLRDLCNKNLLEIVCTGYTEPFISLSPPDLTVKNIGFGLEVIKEFTGKSAYGFLPPFSNWEPSFISHLRALGFRYTLLSNKLFSEENQRACGYWVAEHAGSTIGLAGTTMVNYTMSPSEFIDRLNSIFDNDSRADSDAFITPHYLLPLCSEKTDDALVGLRLTVEEIEKNLLAYQPVCLNEVINTLEPLGLQYIPASLQIERSGAPDLHFLNYLFSFDQIGFIQRKMLDIYDRLQSSEQNDAKKPFLKELFFIQDINRLLPGKEAGFQIEADRGFTYSKMIAVDKQLRKNSKEGRVRITDFLRNGGNTIILSNNNLKVFIDPHHGGQIIGVDFRRKTINLCGCYNSKCYPQPDIIVPNFSRTWFLDRILETRESEFTKESQLIEDKGFFHSSDFDYRIRKTAAGINVSLIRNGSFLTHENKAYPLQLEKLFGLERESSQLLFVYQFSNPSLMAYGFTFSTELNISLPGLTRGAVQLIAGKNRYENLGNNFLMVPSITVWSIVDRVGGVRIQMQTQKPLTIWCLTSNSTDNDTDGLRVILTLPMVLEPSAQRKIIGKILCKTVLNSFSKRDDDAL